MVSEQNLLFQYRRDALYTFHCLYTQRMQCFPRLGLLCGFVGLWDNLVFQVDDFSGRLGGIGLHTAS